MEDNLFDCLGASWIWPVMCGAKPNQYVQFRQEFDLAAPDDDAELYISADSNYALWLNGRLISAGQYHDYPDKKTYDVFAVRQRLQPGRNALCVLVYYQGVDSFQYIPGRPGLMYALRTGADTVVSGLDTRWRADRSYRVENVPRITIQMPFTFWYDAAAADDWRDGAYVTGEDWQTIRDGDIYPVSERGCLQARPVRNLVIKDRLPVRVIDQGYFRRTERAEQTVAGMMQRDFLGARTASEVFRTPATLDLSASPPLIINVPENQQEGVYVILDLVREEVGFFELDMDAPAGTVVDIANGEHLDDLRVRAEVGGRNFAHRYLARSGRQRFCHYFTRLAGRYLQLHFHGMTQPLSLYYAGLRPVEYPIELRGHFHSPCDLQNRIYEVARRTLHLCMHEHYEDCPWREQGLYANDARNQALSGYYGFGEYEFPRASWRLLGEGLKADGYLELCAPAKIPITIPSFSMAWMAAVADHLRFSGDVDFTRQMWPTVQTMMEGWLAKLQEDLLPCPQGRRFWHFYDWADGLDGTRENDCRQFHILEGVRFDAPLNGWLIMALEAAAEMAQACSLAQKAREFADRLKTLRAAVHHRFYRQSQKLYATYVGQGHPEHYAQLTQALMICAGVCLADVAELLRDKLMAKDNDLVEVTLSQSLYKYQALLSGGPRFGPWVFDDIRQVWQAMLWAGATSFWETRQGGADFDGAGSLCHGWSAIPAYFYPAYLLGVRPREAGFKTFVVDPIRNVVDRCAGTVWTPAGPIELAWRCSDDHLVYELSYPKALKPVFPSLSEKDVLNCRAY